MEEAEYLLTSEIQDQHWIWLGRKKIIQSLIEKRISPSRKLKIADVGCGFGCNVPFLRSYGDVIGLEPNESARRLIQNKWGDSVQVLEWSFPEKLDQTFDLIVMAEVLEHVPDDKGAVKWVYEHLHNGAYALLTVPAFKALWTQMDDITHHKRRYSKSELLVLFSGKFEIVYLSYYNFFLFPVKLAFLVFDRLNRFFYPKSAKRSYNETPHFLINHLFKYTLYVEALALRNGLTFPFGAGIVVLAKKRADTNLK